MAKPEKEIQLVTTQNPTGEWTVGILKDPLPLSVTKNADGLTLKFVNKTDTTIGAPAIRLRFKGPVSRNAFQKPKPKDILKTQPYDLKPGDKEEFEVRESLGIADKGSGAPKEESTYTVKLGLAAGPATPTGDPGDTTILIEC